VSVTIGGVAVVAVCPKVVPVKPKPWWEHSVVVMYLSWWRAPSCAKARKPIVDQKAIKCWMHTIPGLCQCLGSNGGRKRRARTSQDRMQAERASKRRNGRSSQHFEAVTTMKTRDRERKRERVRERERAPYSDSDAKLGFWCAAVEECAKRYGREKGRRVPSRTKREERVAERTNEM
jgi:hypothetical protein